MFRCDQTRFFIFLTLASLMTGFANAAAPQTTGPIVELPKFVVTDKPIPAEPESWRYTTLPGIEVLSNASDRETQRILSNFQQFRDALKVAALFPDKGATPLLFVFCKGRTASDLLLPGFRKVMNEPPQGFFNGRSRGVIVIGVGGNVDQESLGLANRAMSKAISEFREGWRDTPVYLPGNTVTEGNLEQDSLEFMESPEQDGEQDMLRDTSMNTDRQLAYLYTKYLMSHCEPPLPFWLQEGMMRIVANMEYEPGYVHIGDPSGFMSYFSPGDAKMVPLLPLADFFVVGEDDLASEKIAGKDLEEMTMQEVRTWPFQAHALAHLCLFGENGKWKKSMAKLIVRTGTSPVTEPLFKECFGIGFKEMGTILRGHVNFTEYTSQQYKSKGGKPPLPAPVEIREAKDSEIGRIKGYALQLAGQTNKARSEFIAPYIRGERDPELLAGLGLIELGQGKPERAVKFLTAATEGRSSNPDAYVALAKLRIDTATASGGKLSPEQTQEVVKLLVRALQCPPVHPETCELLATAWVHSASSPTADDVAPLIRAAIKFPGRMKLVYAAAALSLDAKLHQEARMLAEHGVKFAPDDATRAHFEKLRASLPSVATPPSAPAPAPAKAG